MAYGALAYVVFLIAFLYAVGFVSNRWVPRSVDTGATGSSVASALITDALLLTLFAVQHSLMARPFFKRWWTRIIHPAIERSTFVLLASLILLLMYWKWQAVPGELWRVESGIGSGILTAIYFLGWSIVLVSTFMINHFELFGLKQIFDNWKGQNLLNREAPFRVNYLYGIVRHPIMLGFIIAFWATPVMTIGHLFFSVMTTAYILVAVKFFEERDLKKLYGEVYVRYQREVPMLLPFRKKNSAASSPSAKSKPLSTH